MARHPKPAPGIAKQEYELVPIAAIQPHPRNVNVGNVAAIVESIRANQFFGACLVQRSSGNILAGKHRWLAAQECGLEVIPVIWAEVDDKTALRMVLADNRTCRMGQDDPLKLSELLQEILSDAGSLEGTGFSSEDLDALIAEIGNDILGGAEEEPPKLKPETLKSASLADLAPTDEERAVLTGRKLLVQYSGGKDSGAAAVWVRHYFPDADTELTFVDMGSDFVGFHLHLHDAAKFLGAPLTVLRSKKTVLGDMLERNRWPHFMHPYCHDNLHGPLEEYALRWRPDEVAIIRGGRMSERSRASGAVQQSRLVTVEPTGEWGAKMAGYLYFQPLYYSDKSTSEKLLQEAGAPIWEGYSRGLCRTACRICPGQKPRAFTAIRREFPDVWAELLDLERRFGPGAWQGREDGEAKPFAELADKGQRQLDRAEPDVDELPNGDDLDSLGAE